jgi:hypothetical protein
MKPAIRILSLITFCAIFHACGSDYPSFQTSTEYRFNVPYCGLYQSTDAGVVNNFLYLRPEGTGFRTPYYISDGALTEFTWSRNVEDKKNGKVDYYVKWTVDGSEISANAFIYKLVYGYTEAGSDYRLVGKWQEEYTRVAHPVRTDGELIYYDEAKYDEFNGISPYSSNIEILSENLIKGVWYFTQPQHSIGNYVPYKLLTTEGAVMLLSTDYRITYSFDNGKLITNELCRITFNGQEELTEIVRRYIPQ